MRFTKILKNNHERENLHPEGVNVKKEKVLNVHGQKEPRFAEDNV